MQGHVLAARSAAQPSPAPLPCAGQRGAARPPPPVRWRYRLCNHVCRGMGKNPNTNKRNNPRSVRNAGSQPGGNGAQLRDAPFPRETPGVAGSPAGAAGAWFLGATRAKLVAREPAGQSWGLVVEASCLPGEHPVRNGEEAPAGSQPGSWAKPTGSLFSRPCIISPFQEATRAMSTACLGSDGWVFDQCHSSLLTLFFLVWSPAFPLGVEPREFSGSLSVAATGLCRSKAALGGGSVPRPSRPSTGGIGPCMKLLVLNSLSPWSTSQRFSVRCPAERRLVVPSPAAETITLRKG